MPLPKIDINFTFQARTAVERSEKGISVIIVKDDTDTSFSRKRYLYQSDLDKDSALYTDNNLRYLKEVFLGTPNELIVVRIGTSAGISEAKQVLDIITFDYLGTTEITMQDDIVSFTKTRNTMNNKKIKSVVFKPTTSDDVHIISLKAEKVKRVNFATEEDGNTYIPRMVGLFAGLPFTRSATYYKLNDLEYVSPIVDIDGEIDKGFLCLFNDEGTVRIARAVNSLTTITTDNTKDMQKITVIEAMDLIQYDIYSTFKDMIGTYKNSYNNQLIFISAINTYFSELEAEEILDNRFENISNVDVVTQREILISNASEEQKPIIEKYTDYQVKEHTVGSNMYLFANIKILDAIEDLTFNIKAIV